MAIWTVEQKAEVWYQTQVEADTLEQALLKADESGDWWRNEKYDTEFTDNYWLENQDTEEQFTVYNGITTQEV